MARTSAPLDVYQIRSDLADALSSVSHRRDKTSIVADHLFFALRLHPSAAMVRGITAHGSLTDINDDLKSFWADIRQRHPSAAPVLNLPATLVSAFAPAIERMWAQAVDTANAGLASARQAHAELSDASQRQSDVLRARLDDASTRIATVEAEVEEGRAVANNLRQQLSESNAQIASATLRSEQLLSALATAESDKAAVQALLAGGLDALQRSGDKTSDAFRGEINYLKVQLDGARAAERDLREQAQSIRQGTQLEIQILRQQNNGLLETNGRLNLLNQDLTEKLASLIPRPR